MDCDDCREAVSAGLDDELTDADGVAVEAHLAACGACREAADQMVAVTRLLRTRIAEEPPDLVDRVLSTVLPPQSAAATCGCAASCACGCQQGRPCQCGHYAA